MTKLNWSSLPRTYDAGLDRGVLYLDNAVCPWNGLISVNEVDDSELDVNHYFEGQHLHISQLIGTYQGSISAYTYPLELEKYDPYLIETPGKRFGLSYRTHHGEKTRIHIVYNCSLKRLSKENSSIAGALQPSAFNWDMSATPVQIPDSRPSAHLVIESDRLDLLSQFEDMIYGTSDSDPRLPSAYEIAAIFDAATTLRIIHHGDGSYTIEGPDEVVQTMTMGRFAINSDTLYLLENEKFIVDSY